MAPFELQYLKKFGKHYAVVLQPAIKGVYVLLDKNCKPLRVGSSKHCLRRIREQGPWVHFHAIVLPCTSGRVRVLEGALIRMLLPPRNKNMEGAPHLDRAALKRNKLPATSTGMHRLLQRIAVQSLL